jgi:hypothetical protein
MEGFYVPLRVSPESALAPAVVQDVVYAVANSTAWVTYEITHDEFDRDEHFPIVRSPPHGPGEPVDAQGITTLTKPSHLPWLELVGAEVRVHNVPQDEDLLAKLGAALNQVVIRHSCLCWPS